MPGDGSAEQVGAVNPLRTGIICGKEAAQIAQPGGGQHGRGGGVQNHVAVRMAVQARCRVDDDAAQPQTDLRAEAMCVLAKAKARGLPRRPECRLSCRSDRAHDFEIRLLGDLQVRRLARDGRDDDAAALEERGFIRVARRVR